MSTKLPQCDQAAASKTIGVRQKLVYRNSKIEHSAVIRSGNTRGKKTGRR